MRLKFLIFLFFPLLFLVSCFDVISPWNEWENGKYSVIENPGNPNCLTLYINDGNSGHGRVDYVKQIGVSKSFIIVKSRRKNLTDEYWILDKRKDNYLLNANEIMYGPFTEKEFTRKKKLIGILNLEFEDEFE